MADSTDDKGLTAENESNRIHYRPTWDIRPEPTGEPVRPMGQALGLLARIEAEAPQAVVPTVAMLVCHGMGQQVRYETISSVADCLLTEAKAEGGTADPVVINLSCENQNFLPRAEIKWTDRQKRRHQVHIYEAYWAPLTEGKVTYWDTIKFLVQGGYNGLHYSVRGSFQRWMFGGRKKLEIKHLTFLAIVLMLLVLGLQVGIIGYVSLTLAARYKSLLSETLPTIHGAGFFHAWLAWLAPLLPGISTLLDAHASPHDRSVALLKLLFWVAMIAEALLVRYFVIEYVGDVAAYVAPYKDSKFDELRHQIQGIGLEVGKIIFGFGKPLAEVPQYDKVVIVGHSLGSVLAYDTLNALINLDNVSSEQDQRGVVERTRALVTFGSPLDKTAFIFRMQARREEDWIREQLAASVQPLILDYCKFRPPSFHWVNLWSPMDIISGALDYYDDPDLHHNPWKAESLIASKPTRGNAQDAPGLQHSPWRIENLIDPQASVPLYAHVQYWHNPLLRKQLYKYVTQLQMTERVFVASPGM